MLWLSREIVRRPQRSGIPFISLDGRDSLTQLMAPRNSPKMGPPMITPTSAIVWTCGWVTLNLPTTQPETGISDVRLRRNSQVQ